jgi:NADP-dependent 3-hydroxy acid dehydrogenase YdfG
MNRIRIAHHHANADTASGISQKLSRLGIPFELIDDFSSPLPERLLTDEEPVLMLVSDNFLKEKNALHGLLKHFAGIKANGRLLPVLVDGILADAQRVPTQIDRMVHALHYMNHWQNAWLQLSSAFQRAEGTEKVQIGQDLDETRQIANEIGELITTLREHGYTTLEALEKDDFALFFREFGLMEWHNQYRSIAKLDNLSGSAAGPEQELVETENLEESYVSEALPESKWEGLLVPEPLPLVEVHPEEKPTKDDVEEIGLGLSASDEESLGILEEAELPAEAVPARLEELITDTPPMENLSAAPSDDLASRSPEPQEDEADGFIRDVEFWIKNGQPQRGMELLHIVREQYPGNAKLIAAFERISRQLGVDTEDASIEDVALDDLPDTRNEDAQAYFSMGNSASEKGDFLFAKYCWDRVAELAPDFPGIYRLLGLTTAEHLSDYRETSLHYLQKALAQDEKDTDVLLALASNALEKGSRNEAAAYYERALALNEALRRADLDALVQSQMPAPVVSEKTTEAAPKAEEFVPETPSDLSNTDLEASKTGQDTPVGEDIPASNKQVALITGATSGIGRATAELFAQAGYRLILTGRRVDRLIEIKKQLESAHAAEVLILPFDVRDAGAVQAALGNIPEYWSAVDVLVNNAGLAKGLSAIHEGNLEHWEAMIDTNIKGLLYVTRCISPGMVLRRKGHIINVCSSAGKENYPNGNVYSATKFAVDSLTKGMRMDLHKYNIRVSQVSPGHVEETEFALTRFDGDVERAQIYGEFQPLRSADVAETILFMATRPPHVNIQDIYMFGTQQASSTIIDRSGR